MLELLKQAALIGLPNTDNDSRGFWLGCIGIREDGAQVSAKNGSVAFYNTIDNFRIIPESHAEGRVLRKLGKNGTIYVSRVSRKDGSLAMAMPCRTCQVRIKSARAIKVYYTINPTQYGVWSVKEDYHRVYNCQKDDFTSF
jgi:hypothetical protein